jgi:hypothetical protein
MELINHKNDETYAITQRASSKEDQNCMFDRNKKFPSASKVVRLVFAQRFIRYKSFIVNHDAQYIEQNN